MLKSKWDAVKDSLKHSITWSYVIEISDDGNIETQRNWIKDVTNKNYFAIWSWTKPTLRKKILEWSLTALWIFRWFVEILEILTISDCLFWRGFIFMNKLFSNFLLELFSQISPKLAKIEKAISCRYQKI